MRIPPIHTVTIGFKDLLVLRMDQIPFFHLLAVIFHNQVRIFPFAFQLTALGKALCLNVILP